MEYLDIRTENGELTGEIKERTQVHTDGDIHGTSHVWLVRYTDKNKKKFDILLQKRAATKDAYAGCYDISSAGHIPAGQDYLESAVRGSWKKNWELRQTQRSLNLSECMTGQWKRFLTESRLKTMN